MIILKGYRELEGIRKSCKVAADALRFVQPLVRPGVTTAELNDAVEKFVIGRGATPATLGYKGYPASTCISVNEVVCHGIPSRRVLRDGDILNIDVTTVLDGYYGDTSAMFTVGEVSEVARKLLDVTKKCLEIGIGQVRPGNYLGNIGYYINKYAQSQGFSVVYQFCGHGVGLGFHEEPQVPHVAPKDSGPKLKHGMVFTIEPMINVMEPDAVILEDGWTAVTKDGGLSSQYEHTVYVTRNGVEVLTG